MGIDEETRGPESGPPQKWRGPGAQVAIPLQLPHEEGGSHALEPEYKRMPIGPDHPLYPILIGLALFPILMGASGRHLADDLPEDETHPFFPDHFWPYPIIMVLMAVTVGVLAAFVQKNMALEASADPRTVVIPRPDWYFLFLFQFLKLGPELLMSIVIPPVIAIGLLLWPFIDRILAIKAARRLGWASWPAPGRNKITGTAWVLFLSFIGFLTFWAVAGFTLLGITGG
ncbi:MAG: hypothetical protein ACREPA_01485 [Candidatus Dormibacteraceae bacterium]